MVIGHILTEVHSILYKINPNLANRLLYHVFLDQSYLQPISVEWYLKQLFDMLLVVLILFCSILSQKSPSFNLVCIFGIYFLYNILDITFFAWNYKHGFIKYWILLCVSAISVYFILFPIKNNGTKIIKMFSNS